MNHFMERGTQILFFLQPRNDLIPFIVGTVLDVIAVGEVMCRTRGIQL